MKRILKAVLLIVLGFVLCLGVVVGVSIHRAIRSLGLMDSPDKNPTKQETATKREVQSLFERGDVDGLNRILSIREGEVELTINGPDTFPSTHTPLAELVIVNKSNRSLTMFEPKTERLTEPSYDYKGYLQDDFNLICPVGLRAQCHVLAPGGMLSIPVFFRVSGAGQHKINFSAGFPVYKELKDDSRKCEFPVAARAQFIFEIHQAGQNESNQSPQPTQASGLRG